MIVSIDWQGVGWVRLSDLILFHCDRKAFRVERGRRLPFISRLLSVNTIVDSISLRLNCFMSFWTLGIERMWATITKAAGIIATISWKSLMLDSLKIRGKLYTSFDFVFICIYWKASFFFSACFLKFLFVMKIYVCM